MPKQLPEIPLGRCRNPDFGKTLGEQELKNQPGIALVGFLFAYFAGANLRGVSDPQFVTEFGEKALEPVKESGGFDAHAHRSLQIPVERVGFAARVLQTPLEKQLTCFVVGHGNLLIACVKITSYNNHRSAPFFRALVVEQLPGLLGSRSRRRHPIKLTFSEVYSPTFLMTCVGIGLASRRAGGSFGV